MRAHITSASCSLPHGKLYSSSLPDPSLKKSLFPSILATGACVRGDEEPALHMWWGSRLTPRHRAVLPAHRHRVVDTCATVVTQVELLLHDLCREGLLLPSALDVILDADGYCDAAVGGVVVLAPGGEPSGSAQRNWRSHARERKPRGGRIWGKWRFDSSNSPLLRACSICWNDKCPSAQWQSQQWSKRGAR
jgi:hypothetical protein